MNSMKQVYVNINVMQHNEFGVQFKVPPCEPHLKDFMIYCNQICGLVLILYFYIQKEPDFSNYADITNFLFPMPDTVCLVAKCFITCYIWYVLPQFIEHIYVIRLKPSLYQQLKYI